MNLIKQTLCRRWLTQACRACVWLFLVSSLAHAGWALAAKSKPEPKPAAVSPEEQLTQSVTQWVGRQQGVRPDQIQVQPLDPRVRVQACARALNIDWPFSSTETVRVRCPEPAWQLFIRVQNVAVDARQSANAQAFAGQGAERRPVLVTATHLSRGMTLQAQDVRLASVAVPPGAGALVENPTEVLHAELLRDLPAGTPLRRSDLRPTLLIKRGQLVQLSVGQSTGFTVSARVEAMQDGRMGEQIKLRNPESGRLLTGVVKGPNAVEGL